MQIPGPAVFWCLHSGENKGSRTLTCTHLHAQTCARMLPPSRPTAQSAPNVAVGPLGPIQSLWHPVEGTRIMNSEWTNRKGCGSAHTQPPSPPATLSSSQHPWQPPSQRKPIQLGRLTVTQRLSLQTPAVTVGIAWVTDTVSCFPGTGSSRDRSGLRGGSHIPRWWPSLDRNSQQHHCPLSGPHGRSADPPPPSRGDTIATPTPRLWKPRLGNQGCRLPLCTDRGGAVHTVVYISGFPGVGSEQPEQLYLMTTQGRRWDWPLEPVALRLVPSPPGRPMGIKGPGSRRSKGGGPFPKRLDSMTSDMSSIDRCSNYWAPTECQALWRESGLRW
ncbi:uncharacterized protein LOC109491207 [Ailuropoda melanoleuca]|uniref:uncharacterized protein LOC109491207 n=1 Tax=Ailuropoda melanoleuca TaxID=9646 RepID=UPI001493E543|nr:uncharacterized protein LOC109491207 [Ailuropoda melanoleuca]